jgi:hypothetical protein
MTFSFASDEEHELAHARRTVGRRIGRILS